MGRDYSKYDKERLISHIYELEKQLKNQKYGLYWDKSIEQENVVQQCLENIPILVRNEELSILNTNNTKNNILIEGDNFHALSVLKMLSGNNGFIDAIYIDPPYNTLNKDFKYNDDYMNSDDGFIHSKWLSFMEKRLKLARSILKDDGVIFISIDDNEQANLKLLCDKIFGERNFVNCVVIKMSELSGVKMSHIESRLPKLKEYCLIYSKNITKIKVKPIEKNKTDNLEEFKKYSKYYSKIIVDKSVPVEEWEILPLREYFEKENIKINNDDDILKFKLDNSERMVYRTNNKSFNNIQCDKKIAKITSSTGIEYIWWEGKQMLFLSDYTKSYEGDLWTDISSINLNKEGGVDFQNGKKPLKLLKKLLSMIDKKDAVVLDFFAGSGSTGEAIMDMNREGYDMSYILCTNNENNICRDITYRRLKNVINGYSSHDKNPSNLIYYQTDFVDNDPNTDQAKYMLVEKVNELLCIKEDIYFIDKNNSNNVYYHYFDEDRHMFIYTDIITEKMFNDFVKLINNTKGKKVVYIYSNENYIDEQLIKDINAVVKPIPSKIYEIYKEIVEDIKGDM